MRVGMTETLIRRIRSASLALVIALVPGVAAASSFSMDWEGYNIQRSRNVVVSVDWPGATPDWVNKTIRAGEMMWTWDPTVPAEFAEYSSTFYSYCVELQNQVVGDDNVAIKSTNLLTVSGVPDAGGKAAWLFNSYASMVHSMPIGTGTEIAAAQEAAAGLQVAIWEAMLDSTNDVLNGTFKLSGAINANIKNNAMAFLSGLYSGGPSGYNVGVASWLDAENAQDQIYLPGVPEPGTLILLGSGLIAIALRRRRSGKPS